MKDSEGKLPNPAEPRRLEKALWEARIAQAERSDAVGGLHTGETARLALLDDALKGLRADLPEDSDQFDFALVPGNPPRLWIDMVAFVTMDRDRKTYLFMRDTQHGRQTVAQSTEPGVIASKITDYVAHRMVERERALAGQFPEAAPARSEPAAGDAETRARRFSMRALVLVFILGLALGALCLLLWGFYMVSLLPRAV